MTTMTTVLKGQKKELSDIVSNITPEATPFQTLIGSGEVRNTLFNWTEEALADAADNAAAEGADAGAASDNILAERNNYTQIFTKTVALSGSAQATALAGGVQTLAHQVELRAKELKRDVEKAYLGGQVKASGTTRKTGSYQSQIDASLVVDKSSAALTRDDIDEMLTTLKENGADVNYIMAAPSIIRSISKVLGDDATRDIGNGKDVVRAVKTYESDFGKVELVANNHTKYNKSTKVGDVYIFDSSMWKESILAGRGYKLIELAKTGDSDKRQLVIEKGLKNMNQKGSGLFTNVKA